MKKLLLLLIIPFLSFGQDDYIVWEKDKIYAHSSLGIINSLNTFNLGIYFDLFPYQSNLGLYVDIRPGSIYEKLKDDYTPPGSDYGYSPVPPFESNGAYEYSYSTFSHSIYNLGISYTLVRSQDLVVIGQLGVGLHQLIEFGHYMQKDYYGPNADFVGYAPFDELNTESSLNINIGLALQYSFFSFKTGFDMASESVFIGCGYNFIK